MALLADIGSILGTTLGATTTAGSPYSTSRVPIIWQSALNDSNGEPPLRMTINPQQIQFQQAKRIQKQDTIGGSIYFHFSNKYGQNNDILTLNLSGTTGNVDPRAIQREIGMDLNAKTTRTGAKDNLVAWLKFYKMTLDPIVDMATHTTNLVTMSYASALFQKKISFHGFFANVLQFSETAQEPFQRQWSVNFTVQNTDPPLDQMVSFVTQYLYSQATEDRIQRILRAPIPGGG